MEFRFSPTFAEQYLASVEVLRLTPSSFAVSLLFPASSLIAIAWLATSGRAPGVLGFLAIAAGLAFPFGIGVLTVWHARRRTGIGDGLLSIRFDVDGVEIRFPAQETHLCWSALQRVVETRRFFLFFFGAHAVQFLPKRVVGTESDLGALRALAATRIIQPAGASR